MQDRTEESVSATPTSSSDRPTRMLRLPEVMHRVGIRRSTIYKRMSEGSFPTPKHLGPRCVAWLETDIDEWIDGVSIRGT
ncbi:hypothetical protein B2G71_22760 [Novosphingobium sp. PC22D]|uniref:helix-turn-helix transcriptional regulator n=1 Tax=Novosphingobium sp. PC22D TaxID=1962403 RepID=UPI000BF01682|nr:AlpA family transcriptional regulator [Novosphingobium sp. PC22D]PEQ10333.1 hypothetical protein B2G71_22760 [Novosphingobium sp. PC22D]